jgi:bacterioferritin
MQRADRLVARISFLEGHPNLQKLDPLRIRQTVREPMEADLAAEHDARSLYVEARRYCSQVGDFVTRGLFDDLIAEEEGHIDFLETQRLLFEKFGAGGYGFPKAKPACKTG